MTTGASTQGANITGSVSDEMDPMVVITRGLRTNTRAAQMRDHRDPTPRASARRMKPTNPTHKSSAHQRRWITQGGIARRSPSAKNAPCGKKYPYAWFCTWPSGAIDDHRWAARARKARGSPVRSSLVSAAIRPGD